MVPGNKIWQVLKSIAPYLIISLLVMTVTSIATVTIANPLPALIAKVGIAVSLYALLMWKLNSVVFRECLQYLFKRKKTNS